MMRDKAVEMYDDLMASVAKNKRSYWYGEDEVIEKSHTKSVDDVLKSIADSPYNVVLLKQVCPKCGYKDVHVHIGGGINPWEKDKSLLDHINSFKKFVSCVCGIYVDKVSDKEYDVVLKDSIDKLGLEWEFRV